jgi:DNA-binding beta-propeller fold protein YncE
MALALAALSGCAPPIGGHAASPSPLLYVTNAADGTITRLDAATGRVAGPPLPAGPLPDQAVPGPGGSLLVSSFSSQQLSALTHVAAAGPAGRGGTLWTTGTTWTTRTVPLEAGAREVWLAGDGGRQAVVAYRAPDPATGRPRCRLALVDTWSGTVQQPHTVCPSADHLTALAFDGSPGGPVAYLGVQQSAAQIGISATASASGDAGADRHRLLAVHAATGIVIVTQPLAGAPAGLRLGSAPGRSGFRLYCLETLSSPEEESLGTYHGRLRGLNPITLDVESEHALDTPSVALAVAPDGEDVYLLTSHGYSLTQIHLATGAQRWLASLPDGGISLAVTDERVFVPNPWGHEVWVMDRRQRQPTRRVPVGRGPLHITWDRSL